MKLSCLQENLARALSVVGRAVAPRSTLLSGTNLDLGITSWIGAKITTEGATTVPARTFVDLVNTLPNDRVEMELSLRTQTLSVRCGSYNNNIKCIDAQEFPPLPAIDEEPGITLNMEELREMISQVTFAASSDEARPVLTGVLLEIDGREMTLASADGFRLSVRKAQLPQAAERSVRAIIPARALAELARIAGDDTETVRMVLPANRGQVIFHAESVELVSQLIDGAFPDYKGIIPTGSANRAVVSTEAFLKACKAADIFAREAAHSARFGFSPGGELEPGRVEVSATSAETGSSEIAVDATVEGEAMEVAFNVRFLIDVLNVINAPDTSLETNGPSSPGLIRPVGGDDFLHVVMPMHLGR